MTKIWYFLWTNLSRKFNSWLFVGWLSVVFFSWLSLSYFGLLESNDRQLPAVYQQTVGKCWGSAVLQFRQLSNLKSLSSDQLTLMWLIIPNFSVVPHHGHNTPDSYDKLTLLLQNNVLNNIHTRQSQTNSSWIWVTAIQSAKSNNIINEYLYLIPSICIKCSVDWSRQARLFSLVGLVTCNVSVSSKSMLLWIVCVFTLIR